MFHVKQCKDYKMKDILQVLTVEQRKLLDLHLQKVIEQNKITNLTRITDWDTAKVLHVEDSLIGIPFVNEAPQGDYPDMGTGGGFPGLPVAIVTRRNTVLADSVGKKISALNKIISELSLNDIVSTFNGRIEDLAKVRAESFSAITARALSSLSSLLELASPLLINSGLLICYKSQNVNEELDHAKEICSKLGMEFVKAENFTLSDNKTQRSIIVFKKVSQPSVTLPRRVGLAQRKPF